jgi:putative flippase GtrA
MMVPVKNFFNLYILILFRKFASVGVINTIIHWTTFYLLFNLFEVSQSFSNLFAFIVAVNFSFFLNQKYTFKTYASLSRYIVFVLFMGLMSFAIGLLADRLRLPGLFTLVSFSALSLVLGFLFSHFIVFSEDNK